MARNEIPRELPFTKRVTASGDTELIPAPGVSKQIVLHKGSLTNRGTGVSPLASLRAGNNAARWSARIPANGGTVYFDFGQGWPLAPNLALNANLGATGDVDVNITEFALEDS